MLLVDDHDLVREGLKGNFENPLQLALGEWVIGSKAFLKRMVALGLEVHVESGAGAAAFYPDAEYESVGASLVAVSDEAKGKADVVLKVGRLDPD